MPPPSILPQMSPCYWLALNFSVSLLMLIMSVKLYFMNE